MPTEHQNMTAANESQDISSTYPDYAAKKRRITGYLIAYNLIATLLYVWLEDDSSSLVMIFAVPLLALCLGWCHTDAREHGYKIGKIMSVGLVLLFAVVFPIYVFRTRALRGFLTLGRIGLFAAAMLMASYLTEIATKSLMSVWL